MNETEKKELRKLLGVTWKKWDGSVDDKMVNFCMRSSKYIKIGNKFIDCCNAKPSIESTLYYDDETKGPNTDWEGFYNYNMRYKFELYNLTHRGDEVLVLISQYGKNSDGLYCPRYMDKYEWKGELITAEELTLINNAILEVKDDYIKRLKTYFKKYSDKIGTHGYWANR